MKKLILAIAIFLGASPLWAEVMTYQGRLKESDIPVSANRVFLFEFCDAETSGICHTTPSGYQSFAAQNGLFKSTFTIPAADLSQGQWYLQVSVGPDIPGIVVLTPRERLTAVPYAVFASSAGYASYAAGAVQKTGDTMSGQLTLAGSTLTVTGSEFSVGGSTFTVKAGYVGIGVDTPSVPLTLGYNNFAGWEYSSSNHSVAHKIGKTSDGAGPLQFVTTFNPGESGEVFRFSSMYRGNLLSMLAGGGVGIGTDMPSATLDIISTGTAADVYAQIWRDSTGLVVGSMSATGLMQAVKFVGDGSGLSGVTGATDDTKVLKTGDTMTGPLAVIVDTSVDSFDIQTNGINISTSGAITTVGLGLGTASPDTRGQGAADLQTQRTAADQIASGQFSSISGGALNTAAGEYSVVSGGYKNTAAGQVSNVSGGQFNTVSGINSSVSGGLFNVVAGSNSAVSGGAYNTVTGTSAVIAGGEYNVASGKHSAVGGGFLNTASSLYSAVGAGTGNTASNTYSYVGGGSANLASGYVAVVAGGAANRADGYRAAVGGGYDNRASGQDSVVPGGYNNTAEGNYSFAAGAKSSSTAQGAFTWQDSGGTTINLVNGVTDRTVFKSRGGFLVTGSTNTSMTGTQDRGVIMTGNGLLGIAIDSPQAALDVVSTGTASDVYAQIWRDSTGLVVGSVSAAGFMKAVKFVGDGSGLTGVTGASGTDTSKVLKAGDTMTGDLTMALGSTITVTGSSFSVGGATLAVRDGFVGIGTASPAAPLTIAGVVGNEIQFPSAGGDIQIFGTGSPDQFLIGGANTFEVNIAGTYPMRVSNTGVAVDTVTANGTISAARYYISGSPALVFSGLGNMLAGKSAGAVTTSGDANTMAGAYAGGSNTTGGSNAMVGAYSGYSNISGSYNALLGKDAGYGSSGFSFSKAAMVGYQAGYALMQGDNNVFLGHRAGYSVTVGSSNIVIGADITTPETDSDYTLNIGGVLHGDLAAGTIGISTRAPQAALDIVSTGTLPTQMAQIWRDSTGLIVGSMSVTGAMQAVKFVGNGAGLTGVTALDDTKLALTGGTLGGVLNMNGNFLSGVSTITMLSGSIAIVPPGTGGSNIGYGISIGSNSYNNYTSGIGLGHSARDNYTGGVGIGDSAFDNYSYGVGVGNNATSNNTSGVGIGNGASGNNNFGVGIGAQASANPYYAVGVGAYSQNNKGYGAALGAYSYASSSATALGAQARANAELSLALGYGTVNNSTGTASFGAYGVNAAYYQVNGGTVLNVLPGIGSLAVGVAAAASDTGAYNLFVGSAAGHGHSSGSNNVMLGYGAGFQNTTGAGNVFIGAAAANTNINGDQNIVIGYNQGTSAQGASNELNIGGLIFGQIGAKTVGISTRAPQAALDVVSTGTGAGFYAQIWRDSTGLVVSSVSSQGIYYGNGSGLTSLPVPSGVVQKAGDSMTGALYLDGTGGSNVYLKITQTSGGNLISAGLTGGATALLYADGSSIGLFSEQVSHRVGIGAGMTEALTVTQNRVGVNNTSPFYTLDVNGPGRFADQIVAGGSVTVAGSAFSVGGSTFVVNAGRVGINWTTPEAALQVSGGAKFLSSAGTSYILTAGSSARPDMFFVSSGGIVGAGDFTDIFVDTYAVVSLAPVLKSGADGAVGLTVYARTDKAATVTATGPDQVLAGGNFEAVAGGDDSVTLLAAVRTQLRRESVGVGVVSKAYGLLVDDIYTDSGAGVITDTYGIYIGDQTSAFGGTQTNSPYAIYSQDPGAKVFFAGNLGLGMSNPGARLDIAAIADDPATMGQIWRNSLGNIVSSMSATGVMMSAKFVGDGSGLTNVPGVQKTGDTMTGQLTIFGSSLTIRPAASDAYSLYVSSADGSTPALTVKPGGELYTAGRAGIGSAAPAEALDISGRVLISTNAGNVSTDGLFSNGSGGIVFQSAGTTYLKASYGGGYVGIGPSANVYTDTMSPKVQARGSMSVGSGYNTSHPPAESLVVQGRLGIGTPAPDAALSVVQADVAASSYTVHIGTSASVYHLVVTTAGWVGLNTQRPQAPLHLTAATKDEGIVVEHNSNTAEGSYLALLKARGTAQSQSLVAEGDNLGVLAFGGYNGASGDPFPTAAAIIGRVDGAPTLSPALDMPGRLEFMTAADGTAETVTRMVIRGDGGVGIATGTPQAMLDILSTSTVAQIWRDATGVVRASMTADGTLYAAVGSAVQKSGDNMTGPLTITPDPAVYIYDLMTNGIQISTAGSIVTVGVGNGSMGAGQRGMGVVDLQTARATISQVALGDFSTLSGGAYNTAFGSGTVMAGGLYNIAAGTLAVISGGQNNYADARFSAVGGGKGNTANADYAGVFSGSGNLVAGAGGFIGGGQGNTVEFNYGAIAGGMNNLVDVAADYGFVGGGYGNKAANTHAAVAGGWTNAANGMEAFVGAGYMNAADGEKSVVGGGNNNTVTAFGLYSAVVGGSSNTVAGEASFVGGGNTNVVSGKNSVVPGGLRNTVTAIQSGIMSGNDNVVTGTASVVSGGDHNVVSGQDSVIAGGANNSAKGWWATIPGGYQNSAVGNYSFAAGYKSSSTAAGAFTWADSQGTEVLNGVPDQVRFKAAGGFMVSTSAVYSTPGLYVNEFNAVGIGTATTRSDLTLFVNRGASQNTFLLGSESKGLRLRDTGSLIDIESVGSDIIFNASGQGAYFYQGKVGFGTTASGVVGTKVAIVQPFLTTDPYVLKVGTGTNPTSLTVSTSGVIGMPMQSMARAYGAASVGVPSSTLWQPVSVDAKFEDTQGEYDTTTQKFTATTGGLYLVAGHVWIAANATGSRGIGVGINGSATPLKQATDVRAAGVSTSDLTLSSVIRLLPGEFLRLMVYQDSGSTLNVGNATFDVVKLN
ncbi:MAG: hypothetical protein A2X30_10630 [Elusimicrobia bacterium GWB2_63_16]|nr:MAG: hypothetical protein A2X30_10630 [Elusimicrobia bacterium GWB2_63_16]